MSRLGDAKTLGGIGSILQLVPGVSIVGYILVLIGVHKISEELQDRSIFNDMLYAVITGIVGVVVAVVTVFASIFSSFASIGTTPPATFPTGGFLGIIGGLAVLWIFFVISALFIRKAYEKIGTRLNNGSFKTAGTLYFVGALLTIILVGFIILFIAYIFQIVAFFSISEAAAPMMAQPGQAPVAAAGVKFCAKCGTQMEPLATFCPKCGAKQ